MISTMIKKGKKSDTINSTAQNKRSHAMKMILRPGTPKISTIEKKCQKHDRKSMGQNLKEMTTFLKSRQNQLSKNITFKKNGDGMHKICLSELKIEYPTSIAKIGNKTASKLKNTCTNVFILEPTF